MSIDLDALIATAQQLPAIPLASTTAYYGHTPELVQFVDDALAEKPNIAAILGHNPLQVMHDNHRHHASFMATVFSVGDYGLLARTVPWVYRAYHAHGFSYAYFPIELTAWQTAVGLQLTAEAAAPIQAVYRWMIDSHDAIVAISESEVELVLPVSEDWLERKDAFLAALLQGDRTACVKIATESVTSGVEIAPFYQQIIQPVMYEVGMLWERAEISVAQEHLASAIVGRVMAGVSMVGDGAQPNGGRAIITSIPNEFHEIGAWMISDILEQDGWQVKYLGANIPLADLIGLIDSFKPNILALSVTVGFNVDKAKQTIAAVRQAVGADGLRIMVGGRVFNENPDLWRRTGADGSVQNALEARSLAAQWLTEASNGQ